MPAQSIAGGVVAGAGVAPDLLGHLPLRFFAEARLGGDLFLALKG
jgi:hypothetical protein